MGAPGPVSIYKKRAPRRGNVLFAHTDCSYLRWGRGLGVRDCGDVFPQRFPPPCAGGKGLCRKFKHAETQGLGIGRRISNGFEVVPWYKFGWSLTLLPLCCPNRKLPEEEEASQQSTVQIGAYGISDLIRRTFRKLLTVLQIGLETLGRHHSWTHPGAGSVLHIESTPLLQQTALAARLLLKGGACLLFSQRKESLMPFLAVAAGGPAAQVVPKAGDTVTAVNGIPLKDEDSDAKIAAYKSESRVKIGDIWDSWAFETTVTVATETR